MVEIFGKSAQYYLCCLFKKIGNIYSLMFLNVPNHHKSQEACDKAVGKDPVIARSFLDCFIYCLMNVMLAEPGLLSLVPD